MNNISPVEITQKPFEVKLENFTGPFDLFVHLIEEKQMDIYEVSLGEITDSYLAYLEQCAFKDINIAADFLLMAAILIELKSKMLLPEEEEPLDLAEEMELERRTLLERLVRYKVYKKLAVQLSQKEEQFRKLFNRFPVNEQIISSTDEKPEIILKKVKMQHLVRAFQRAWDRAVELSQDKIGEILDDKFTVKEKIAFIAQKLHLNNQRLPFSELFTAEYNQLEVITAFLAVLELIRLQFIAVVQEAHDQEIEIVALRADNYLIEDKGGTKISYGFPRDS